MPDNQDMPDRIYINHTAGGYYAEQRGNHQTPYIRASVHEERVRELEAVAKAAQVWLANMKHGRDHTDEGYSRPREQDEDALAEAVESYNALTPTKETP